MEVKFILMEIENIFTQYLCGNQKHFWENISLDNL